MNTSTTLTTSEAGMPVIRQSFMRHSGSALIALSLLAAALGSGALSDYGLEIGFRLMLMLTLAEAWNLLAGYGGLVSLGTAAFFGVGAYTMVAMLNGGHGMAAAWLVAGGAAALMALLLSRAVFRLRGLYFTVGTLAMAESARLFMVNHNGFGGATGIFLNGDPPDLHALFLLAVGLAALTTLLMSCITGSRLSILLRAVRDDEDAAQQMGVRPFRIKLLAFLIASFLMGLGGALQGLKLGAVEPYGTFGMQWTVNVLSIVIIGGQGLRAGPLVGAVFVVALGELLADYPAIHLLLTGLILILVIRFAPKGLMGLGQTWVNRWLKKEQRT
jgi:branched-chain amino acid transport system permease protein